MEPIVVYLKKDKVFKIKPKEAEIFGILREGSVVLTYGDEIHNLTKGQTFYFEIKKHIIIKAKEDNVEIQMISTPPIF
jgi:mannose-6-phosphate isomerase-like protein (cupin superfamily)